MFLKLGKNEFPASGSDLTSFFVGVFCRFHGNADIILFVVRCLGKLKTSATKWQVAVGGCVIKCCSSSMFHVCIFPHIIRLSVNTAVPYVKLITCRAIICCLGKVAFFSK